MAKLKDAKLKDLVFDNKNFNKHTEFGMSLIEKSLRNNGAGRSILIDKHNRIIAGNGVTEVAGQIGLDDVQIVETDGTKIIAVKRTDIDLDTKQGREMALADNATGAADLQWDADAIADVESEFDIDASAWGVNLDFEDDAEQPTASEDDFDESTDAIENRCKKGDVWLLGNHRLMCGDSTSAEDVARLMDGEKADITFSSPPYNMMQTGFDKALKSGKVNVTYKIQDGTYNEFGDNLSDEEYADLLNNSMRNGLANSDDVLFNIGILASSKLGVIDLLSRNKKNFCDILVWNKDNSIPLGLPSNRGMVSHRCELIFCFNQSGNRSFSHPQWRGGQMERRNDD